MTDLELQCTLEIEEGALRLQKAALEAAKTQLREKVALSRSLEIRINRLHSELE